MGCFEGRVTNIPGVAGSVYAACQRTNLAPFLVSEWSMDHTQPRNWFWLYVPQTQSLTTSFNMLMFLHRVRQARRRRHCLCCSRLGRWISPASSSSRRRAFGQVLPLMPQCERRRQPYCPMVPAKAPLSVLRIISALRSLNAGRLKPKYVYLI